MLSRLQGRGLPFARRVVAPNASSHPVLCRALTTESPRLPFAGVRVFEKSKMLTGRLAGLLFADQGAEVLVLNPQEGADVDPYLNRNKISITSAGSVSAPSVDVIILDGTTTSSYAPLPFL
jgi:hypothetical protein